VPAEIETLLKHASGRTYGILLVAASAGLRTDEILHLTWGDVDHDEGAVRVTAKEDWTPKSYESRTVYVGPRLLAYLKALRKDAKATADTDYLRTRTGKPLGVYQTTRMVRAVFESAGLYVPGQDLVHRIRHSWATHGLQSGVDLETMRELMGDADIATTGGYLRATDESRRRAVKHSLIK
jgi:integrase